MYPYEEDSAGVLRTTKKTGDPSEALRASSHIVLLAKELLPEPVYSDVEELAVMLTRSRSNKKAAREVLVNVLLPPPKRPLYYLERELKSLPGWTRDSLRLLGDYTDMLTKAAVYERTQDERPLRTSFGPAINAFARHYQNEARLVDWLSRYNLFLYRDAKHDFALPPGRREHRFTSREVVLSLYITRQLAERLKQLSPTAMKVSLDQTIIGQIGGT